MRIPRKREIRLQVPACQQMMSRHPQVHEGEELQTPAQRIPPVFGCEKIAHEADRPGCGADDQVPEGGLAEKEIQCLSTGFAIDGIGSISARTR